jgi:hypothetical protein
MALPVRHRRQPISRIHVTRERPGDRHHGHCTGTGARAYCEPLTYIGFSEPS